MKLTVYDFDGTIYDGDSSINFIKFLIRKKKTLIFKLPKMLLYLIKYKLKLISKEEMKECFFSVLNKFNNIDDLIKEFWNINEIKIKDFFINDKRKNIIIASASPYFLLEPIAKKYKVKDLFASPIDKINGKYTWSQGIYNIINRAKDESDEHYNIVFDLVIPEDKHIVDEIFNVTNKETSECEEIIRILMI